MAGRRSKLQLIEDILREYPDGLTAREIADEMSPNLRENAPHITQLCRHHPERGFYKLGITRVMQGMNWKQQYDVIVWGIKHE